MLDSFIVAGVSSYTPSLHPQGHMNMWYSSPLTRFEPHLVTALLAIIIIFGVSYFIYVKRKHRDEESKWTSTEEEKTFRDLMSKKNMTLKKLLELEEAYDKGELNEMDYQKKTEAYKAYLHKVKKQLNQFLT
ncbi:hypothetical protein CR194_09450 [Salipaludibacillus keqinensis]|uniref:Uncharacterized protein n=1 Tax=Salipaludibacillus keqinensis TaxID=2045207 RepID=A0A323TEA4_9BACI|nr:hypothetical protein [Salipaludibacillus keqinensis]PYZ93398.1 hypothetical protein CR194_09450 [Salipaludibacillus keqinensis]